MKDLFAEYGRFVIAIVGAAIILWAIGYLPNYWESFIQIYVKAITGA